MPRNLILCLCLATPVLAQNSPDLGKASVAAVLDHYTINPLVRLPETHQALPPTGRWSIATTRPDTCPHDTTPCARVLYTVPDARITCEWTVVPGQSADAVTFLDQNEAASRHLLRKLPATALAPLILKDPQPMYPAIARSARVAGSVVVRLVVSEKGTVTLASPVSGPPLLQGAAVDAANHWLFQPIQVGPSQPRSPPTSTQPSPSRPHPTPAPRSTPATRPQAPGPCTPKHGASEFRDC